MTSPVGIPTTRVSDQFISARLLRQIQYDQIGLFRAQEQMSTGHRFQIPSEDPQVALRAISVQRMLQYKAQVSTNLKTTRSFLTMTETALSSAASALSEIRSIAMGVVGTTSTDAQREAAAQQVTEAIRLLIDTGNQTFRDRYLFGGAKAGVVPYQRSGTGNISYSGDEGHLPTYTDVALLADTNLTGSEVFGGISDPVRGTAIVRPVLTADTRLADLHDGTGIAQGSIEVVVGGHERSVNLSGAETLGDVARLIKNQPPSGATLEVDVTPDGLRIEAKSGGSLVIREDGGTTAADLGIFKPTADGSTVIQATPTDPRLNLTTSLGDLYGKRARAVVRSGGDDNDILLEAPTNGTAANGREFAFVNTTGVDAGTEWAEMVGNTITVHIRAGKSIAKDVVEAINRDVPNFVHAAVDPVDGAGGGLGPVQVSATAIMSGGSGTVFDATSGLRIVNGGQTQVITFEGCSTIEDLLNRLNSSTAGVYAALNASGNGLELRSRLSGNDFMIGENGGLTATQWGLRSMTEDTRLSALNYGQGVADASTAIPANGADFTISTLSGAVLSIDVQGAETVGKVLERINQAAVAAGSELRATINPVGNGILLSDPTPSAGQTRIQVAMANRSFAAVELGLIPQGQTSTESGSHTTFASATTNFVAAGYGNVRVTSTQAGPDSNGVHLVFQNAVPAEPACYFDPAKNSLIFNVNPGVTTTAEIAANFAASGLAGQFSLQVVNGGVVGTTDRILFGGNPESLAARDVNPQETTGIFNALMRLETALIGNDLAGIERSITLLDQGLETINFTRGTLGARQQGLDVLENRQEEENIELQQALSLDYDVDFAEVVSTFNSRQIAYEASLKTSASIFRMTLIDYL